ncbi:MAG: helix-turn-helix transcriptional regulator [Clostridia bacterium]|nr:helix-turn-helix transcriptional regulator [Clostridia bacterium]MBR0406777.1 helix-turn-helix transcriptional regulator [Clostridia bacterium]
MDGKKEINISIGGNIKRAREKAGLTQEQLSEMIGIGPKSLSAVERGTVGVSVATLRKICNVLPVSSDALIFGGSAENDVRGLASRLERLTPKQYDIARDVLYKLLEAFQLKE